MAAITGASTGRGWERSERCRNLKPDEVKDMGKITLQPNDIVEYSVDLMDGSEPRIRQASAYNYITDKQAYKKTLTAIVKFIRLVKKA